MDCDLLVVGGGINGTSIAAEAQSRGLSVTLCERGDLAQGTSSASSNLIHGGLRYLEQYQFGLVRKALKERECLLEIAPHLITPLPFTLPYDSHMRPFWLLRSGLFIYDNLYQSTLNKTVTINRKTNPTYFEPLKENFEKGFLYYDAMTDDARLVISNALQAKHYGAKIFTHTPLISSQRTKENWQSQILLNGVETRVTSKAIINATGPWASKLNQLLGLPKKDDLKLIKGSHIIIPALYHAKHAYILQNNDNRIIFTIPFLDKYTLVGTTDVNYMGTLEDVKISEDEKKYLLKLLSHYFTPTLKPSDIVSDYSGVRALIGENSIQAKNLNRDYKLELEDSLAPVISVCGGKVTTFRVLGEQCINLLKPYFPGLKESLSQKTKLPGGDIDSLSKLNKIVMERYPWLPKSIAERYCKNYGSRVFSLLDNSFSIRDLGSKVAASLYEKELQFLVDNEWASSIHDILFRRTKIGLTLSKNEKEKCLKFF